MTMRQLQVGNLATVTIDVCSFNSVSVLQCIILESFGSGWLQVSVLFSVTV